MLEFKNDGEKLVSTNYFDSNFAKLGEFYLTWNNNVGRLLVPDLMIGVIDEIKSTTIVEIEYIDGGLDLFFIDDDPDYPYQIRIAKEQTDRFDRKKGKTKIAVYTKSGLINTFDAEVIK